MRSLSDSVSRRRVIESYVAYDGRKKGKPIPETADWPWDDSNGLDRHLEGSGFKYGILSGYVEWREVALRIEDLRCCAVEIRLCPRDANGVAVRDLGSIERMGCAKLPQSQTTWSGHLAAGGCLSRDEPMILRPAVGSERPARWYIEDGSGRGMALMACAGLHAPDEIVAYGYLGDVPDPTSHFMQDNFAELLNAASDWRDI
jgi:hypothetical protein